jgi:hypothetical protein
MTAVATKSEGPTWSILVPTLGERRALFERLMAGLLPQTDRYTGRVRVVGWLNNGRPSLPEIRQTLVTRADTDYVSFVDDDDLVSLDYVDEIMAALDQRPDYVGFQVQCYSNDRPTLVAYHSLKYGDWVNLPDRYLRDISHINPMRTSLARTADFRRARPGAPEDRAWVGQLRRSGVLKHEVTVDRVMYHYLYSTSRQPGAGSRWRQPRGIHQTVNGRAVIDHPHFTWSADGH